MGYLNRIVDPTDDRRARGWMNAVRFILLGNIGNWSYLKNIL